MSSFTDSETECSVGECGRVGDESCSSTDSTDQLNKCDEINNNNNNHSSSSSSSSGGGSETTQYRTLANRASIKFHLTPPLLLLVVPLALLVAVLYRLSYEPHQVTSVLALTAADGGAVGGVAGRTQLSWYSALTRWVPRSMTSHSDTHATPTQSQCIVRDESLQQSPAAATVAATTTAAATTTTKRTYQLHVVDTLPLALVSVANAIWQLWLRALALIGITGSASIDECPLAWPPGPAPLSTHSPPPVAPLVARLATVARRLAAAAHQLVPVECRWQRHLADGDANTVQSWSPARTLTALLHSVTSLVTWPRQSADISGAVTSSRGATSQFQRLPDVGRWLAGAYRGTRRCIGAAAASVLATATSVAANTQSSQANDNN